VVTPTGCIACRYKLGTLYNMVGFQTKLKIRRTAADLPHDSRLENAEFARLGGLHRNTFLNSPSC